MASPEQPKLIEIPEQPWAERAEGTCGELKLRRVDRRQTTLLTVDVEALIGAEHKARAIWELVGRMDLTPFRAGIKTREGQAGREAWDPQLLVSLWVYAYSEGIGSAREIERQMEWEPGFQWLGGLARVNYHTLSDFRVGHRAALDGLFAQLLGMLEHAGCLSLERVMHDGTKIRAQAGADTFRRERTVKEHLERARAVVAQMGDPCKDEGAEAGRSRKRAAQERAARERQERVERAYEELQALQQEQASEQDKQAVRVSVTEPEARVMRHGDNAIAPSYNAQVTTDAQHKIIVGVHLSQSSSDAQSLAPALVKVEENLGRRPEQVVVDGGFTNRDTIVACAQQQTDLIGSLPDPAERSAAAMKSAGIDPAFAPAQFVRQAEGDELRCPAGYRLKFLRQSRKRGNFYRQYQAQGADCRSCALQPRCCPKHAAQGRLVSILVQERAEVAEFRKKMQTPEARAIYRQRGPVAEFPNAWIKDKLGLRKFRVRGMAKAGMEMLWASLTYNVMAWIRLCWRPQRAAVEYFTAAAVLR
jgi:transposase